MYCVRVSGQSKYSLLNSKGNRIVNNLCTYISDRNVFDRYRTYIWLLDSWSRRPCRAVSWLRIVSSTSTWRTFVPPGYLFLNVHNFADPDPGFSAFLNRRGSGMGKKSRCGTGMNIPDHISESWETIFWVKNTSILNDADPGSGIFSPKFGSWINILDPQHCL